MTSDWMRAGCSHPVSRPGFISSCSTVCFCTSHLPENIERNAASQPDSQLDRKRSSKGVRGCAGWFMPRSGMLNEFRVHCCYGNCLNGHCLIYQLCISLSQRQQLNVEMWHQFHVLILHWTYTKSSGRRRRKLRHLIATGPRSEYLVSDQWSDAVLSTGWQLVVKQ